MPNCQTNKRTKRDTIGNDSSEDEGQPATIQVYSGLYVNENAEILDNDQDSVFAEKVSTMFKIYQLNLLYETEISRFFSES